MESGAGIFPSLGDLRNGEIWLSLQPHSQLVEKPKDSRASTPGHEHPPLPDLVATGKHPVTPYFQPLHPCYATLPLWSAGKSPPSQVELEE